MVHLIINTFDKINNYYEQLIKISEEKFTALKVKDLLNLDKLNKEEMLTVYDLQEQMIKLKKQISLECQNKNIKEEKLISLVSHMTVEEKEKVMAAQETAITNERKLKNNLKMNKRLAEALVESTQTVIEAWGHVAKQEQKSGSVFIDKEL